MCVCVCVCKIPFPVFQLLCALGFMAVASCVIVGVVVYYAGVAGLQQVIFS